MQITAAVSREDQPHPVLESLELADPGPGEVLVRVVATGICHTDLHFHGEFGSRFAAKPMVLGHEGSGVVEAVGPGVVGLEVGDHVVMSGNSCGQCKNCLSGRPVYCVDVIKLCFCGSRRDGSSPISQDGARINGSFFGQSSFATYSIASERTAVKVPKDLPLHLMGPLGCGLVTGAASVLEGFRLRPGQSIVVFGSGGVGLAAVMAARIAGASRIVAVDLDAERLELARSLGADDVLLSNADTLAGLMALEPGGFDFSLNSTQAVPVFDTALACLALEGVAGILVEPSQPWTPDVGHLLHGGRRLQGFLGGGANAKVFIPMIAEYWRKGMFPFERLITEFPFSQIDEAWEQFRAGKVIKPVLRM